jgi:hypothetical protein
VDTKKPSSRADRKSKLSNLLKTGASSLVIATAVVAAPPADASLPSSSQSVVQRAEEVRSQLNADMLNAEQSQTTQPQLAWWGNWHNWGWHPWWHNWPNWHNWHNWGNWHNW